MKEVESKDYSWKWITASELLTKQPCDLCFVILTCDDANDSATIYDGESASGEIVATIKALQNRSVGLNIHHHIFCRKGLYVALGDNCLGALIQWLEKPAKGGGS